MDQSELYVFRTHELIKENPIENKSRNLCPVPRSGHRSVMYNGNLYVYGGFTPWNPIANGHFAPHIFKEMLKFNYATKTWRKLHIKGEYPAQAASHAAALYHNKMIVYGGTGIPFGEDLSNATHLCNLETLEWNMCSTSGESAPPLYGQAIAVYNNKLYVVGGTSGTQFYFAVTCLDLLTCEWTRLDTSATQTCLPEPRYRHEIVVYNNNIYVFGGGMISDSYDLISIPVFSLIEKKWSFLDTTSNENCHPVSRFSHGCVHMDNVVYVFGGYDNVNASNDIWKFDLLKLTWTKLHVSLPVPLFFHSVSLSEEGQAVIFGGVIKDLQGIRTNDLYTMWLKIPSLSQMCWQAIIKYIPHIGHIDRKTLFEAGIPSRFLHEIEFEES